MTETIPKFKRRFCQISGSFLSNILPVWAPFGAPRSVIRHTVKAKLLFLRKTAICMPETAPLTPLELRFRTFAHRRPWASGHAARALGPLALALGALACGPLAKSRQSACWPLFVCGFSPTDRLLSASLPAGRLLSASPPAGSSGLRRPRSPSGSLGPLARSLLPLRYSA